MNSLTQHFRYTCTFLWQRPWTFLLPLLLLAMLLLVSPRLSFAQTDVSTSRDTQTFTTADIAFLHTFTLTKLPPLPLSASNKFADNLDAAKLGKKLFFDLRLSANNQVSCASCHQPEKYFTDGLALAKGIGQTKRSTPTLFGTAWSPWQYWDGRKDSLWSQALEPIEHPNEMGSHRSLFANKILQFYRQDYENIFGKIQHPELIKKLSKATTVNEQWQALPEKSQKTITQVFTNAGKALMAYQRKLTLSPSRFDQFVTALASQQQTQNKQPATDILSKKEIAGLRLFMGKANCSSCHNGPLFTNHEFHNIGAPEADRDNVDLGRYSGVKKLVDDEFTCLSPWSDAKTKQCEEMLFLKQTGPELVGAFKTPTLRNIAQTAPYMHAGQFKTLQDVISHYNTPVPPFYDRKQHPNRPHFDIMPLKLSPIEQEQIIAFLSSLTSPLNKNDPWLSH